LVDVPAQFDDRSFEQFAGAYAAAAKDGERLLFDAHAAEWASPYGLVGLLAAGQAAHRPGSADRPLLTAPTQPDVLTYWTRAGFFREAAELFEIHGKLPRVKPAEQSDVLLPVTPVRAAEDVHAVVSKIQQRASAILASELGLEPKAPMGFAMALSEACQNIVEHAGTGGWVAVQAYHWRRKLARAGVVMAVAGRGRGLEGRPPGLSGCPGAHHHPGAGIHDAVIQHIDVHAVLQESVSGVYTDLVTRPTGRVVREHIERAMATAQDPVTVTRIDF